MFESTELVFILADRLFKAICGLTRTYICIENFRMVLYAAIHEYIWLHVVIFKSAPSIFYILDIILDYI